RHPVAAAPGQARQKPGATHVGEETDGRLRHGQQRAITCHAMAAMGRKPYAPAHADLVDQGDAGLAIAVDGSIEPILFIEELTRQRAAFLARVPNGPYIPPGAEGLLARPLDQDGANRGILGPGIQTGLQSPHHSERQSVQAFRPIEGDDGQGSTLLKKDFRLFRHGVPFLPLQKSSFRLEAASDDYWHALVVYMLD